MVKKFTSEEILEAFGSDHASLLSRINQICTKLSDSSLEQEAIFLISEIHAVIAIHFKKEEDIMKQQHDVNFTKHKVDHESFLAELKTLMERTESTLAIHFGESLFQRCATWFAEHDKNHDKFNLIRTEKAQEKRTSQKSI